MAKLIISEKQFRSIKKMMIERELLNEQTKDEIKQVQQKLKDCFGAYLGKGGPNKDGVDGLCGDKTKAAIEQYTSYRFVTENDVKPEENKPKDTEIKPEESGVDLLDVSTTDNLA